MMPIIVFGWVLMVCVALVEPFFERREMQQFVQNYQLNGARLTLYRRGFIRTWLIGIIFVGLCALLHITPHQLSLQEPSLNAFLEFPAYLQVLMGAFLVWWVAYFFLFAVCIVRIGQKFRPYMLKKMTPVEGITPRTGAEYFWWIANAFSSPIEELIYRGFIFFFFITFYPSVPLFFIVLISIGLEAVHYAPRWAAMKYVATSGLAFTLCFLLFHSVIAAMILHVIYDLRTLAVPFHWVRKAKEAA